MGPFTPKHEKKCWGEVVHMFCDQGAAVSHLKVKRGTRCSRHYHEDRANAFYVISGKVVIEEWDTTITNYDPSLKTLKILNAGDHYTVPSTVIHRFRVLEDGEMVEVYWPDRGGTCRADDICRLDVGGIDSIEALHRDIAKCLPTTR
tara:strand:+ start:1111 stop:1551 length:441 start_codon:yes stop_codon:yes gene_type:complete